MALRRRVFRDLHGRAVRAIVHRHLSTKYEAIDISGSIKSGGRWNPKDEFGALYTALDEETALAELQRLAERQGLSAADLAPRDLASIRVSLSKVLDLTDGEVLERLQISRSEILRTDVSLCLDIARLSRSAGFEAILAPSATRKGSILVVFPERLFPSSRLEVIRRKTIR